MRDRFFKFLLLANVFFSSAWASPAPVESLYPPSESMLFKMKFIDTTAGECLLETLPPTAWEGRPALHFRATIKTIGLIGVFYSYNEVVDLYFDRERQIPLYVDINIHDRKKFQHTQIRFNTQNNSGEEIEDSTEPDSPAHHRVKNWSITPGAQSLFSIMHFLRTYELQQGSQVSFPVSHDEKNTTFAAEVIGMETIRAGKSDREAYILKVAPTFTHSYYPNVQEMPLLWVANDSRRALLRFEFKHRLGKVFGVLESAL